MDTTSTPSPEARKKARGKLSMYPAEVLTRDRQDKVGRWMQDGDWGIRSLGSDRDYRFHLFGCLPHRKLHVKRV